MNIPRQTVIAAGTLLAAALLGSSSVPKATTSDVAVGVAPEQLSVVDLYSCFPIVPKLGSLHLGLDRVELSATGGLSSFGGPHNNYSSHAIVAVTRPSSRSGVIA